MKNVKLPLWLTHFYYENIIRHFVKKNDFPPVFPGEKIPSQEELMQMLEEIVKGCLEVETDERRKQLHIYKPGD